MTLSPPPPGAAVAGMGRMTLDILHRPGVPPRAQAGGTCGNVLANLAFLGWRALPVGRLGDDDAGRIFRQDMERVGVDPSLLTLVPGVATPAVVHAVEEGEFSPSCHLCGRALPEVVPMPPEALPELPAARVFFFDEDSPASLLAARRYKERGALIVYEPNYAGPEVDLDAALAVADVLKYSAAKVPGLAGRIPKDWSGLVIETRGAGGLRCRNEPGWLDVPAYRVPVVRDAAGAGDWTTAGVIHGLALGAELPDALLLGMALGAHACAFVGARGNAHAVTRERLADDVRRILAGEVFDPGAAVTPVFLDAGRFCVCRVGSLDSKTGQPAETP